MIPPAPHYSIIVPVLDETDSIRRALDRLRSLERQEEAEILVIDGDPQGTTLQAIVRRDVLKILSARGRGRQMNEGAKKARGEILLFLHADTDLPGDALGLIDDALRSPRIVGGAFDLGFPSARIAFRVIAAAASLRSRLTRVPFGDQALFFRRAYFERIGGYRDIPLMEDVELMGRIRRRGDPITIIAKPVLTSPRRWEAEGLLRCTLRNWLLQGLYLLGVPPGRLAEYYRTHPQTPAPARGIWAGRQPKRPSRHKRISFPAVLVAFLLTLMPFTGRSGDRVLFREDFHSLENWRPLHFPKIAAHTRYFVEKKDRGGVLAAVSRASASALVYAKIFDIYEYPRARWRWKVDNVYRNADPGQKAGDDYPLRIYVTFSYDPLRAKLLEKLQYGIARQWYGEYPPHSTLSYVWASQAGQERLMTSPYTERAKLLALQRGSEKAGAWQIEEVNMLEDYRLAFGMDPPAAAGLAIMNDSDDTGEGSRSYLDFIEVFQHGK